MSLFPDVSKHEPVPPSASFSVQPSPIPGGRLEPSAKPSRVSPCAKSDRFPKMTKNEKVSPPGVARQWSGKV